MNNRRSAVLLLLAITGATSCYRSSSGYQSSAPPGISSGTPSSAAIAPIPAATPNRALTNSPVETAIGEMLSGYRLGGSVTVRGIRELPQQNSAVADLQFDDFEYPTTFEGNLLRAKDFKPKKRSNALIPPPRRDVPAAPRPLFKGRESNLSALHGRMLGAETGKLGL